MITKLNVTDPRAKNHTLTRILYDRYGGDSDYHYTKVRQLYGGMKVMIPFAGSLRVDYNFEIIRIITDISVVEPDMWLMPKNGGRISYGYSAEYFAKQFYISPDKGELIWKFNPDWNVILHPDRLAEMTYVYFACTFSLELREKGSGNVFPMHVMITSSEEKEPCSPGSVKIEPIQILRGCLAVGTLVRMPDGSEKKIEEIYPGERILTIDGHVAEVRSVVNGEEYGMYQLETESGRSLLMTDTHPVRTMRGWIPAADIKNRDVIITDRGGSLVREIYRKSIYIEVYSLILEPSSGIYCNGIEVGDFTIKNSI